jgi:hypothetical protein
MLLKCQRIRARLGWTEDLVTELEKPPRMHWRTFERLNEAAAAAWHESFFTSGCAKRFLAGRR